MIYISGKNEKLCDLAIPEEFLDFISNEQKFYQANPHLSCYRSGSNLLSHTPILLSADFPELKQYIIELNSLSPQDRERLWLLQECGTDIPTLLATNEVMSEAQKYAEKFRKFLNDPLISTPWVSTDPVLTNNTLFDLTPGVFGIAAGTLQRMRYVEPLDALYEAMCTRDALNTEIARLAKNKHLHYSQISKLEKHVSTQTKIIKSLLPKKINDKLVKFLNMRGINVYKARGNHFSKKMARKGKCTTLGLEFLEKTGLEKAKKLIRGLIKLGKYADKATFALGAGVVVYDTVKARKQNKDFAKVFLSGTAGLCAGLYMGSAASLSGWGACAICTLAGDAALGGLILASAPILGTFVLMIVGAAVVGTATYVAAGVVKNVLETEIGTKSCDTLNIYVNILFDLIYKAYKYNEPWIIKYYGVESSE